MRDTHDAPQYRGKSVIGSYRLIQILGSGPVSQTFLVEHQNRPGKKFVLKIMEGTPLSSLVEEERALLEVAELLLLQHRHVVFILEHEIYEQKLYLVTPYAEGGSLRHRLAAAPGTSLPLQEALTLLKQIGGTLHFIHQREIVHANLKPENILFRPNGEALLTDFRLFALTLFEPGTSASSTCAHRYLAPEQIAPGLITPLTDQYALACIACELLTGSPPFTGNNAEALKTNHLADQPTLAADPHDHLAQHFAHILLRALSKKPEERYPCIEEFILALRECAS